MGRYAPGGGGVVRGLRTPLPHKIFSDIHWPHAGSICCPVTLVGLRLLHVQAAQTRDCIGFGAPWS